MRRTTIALQAVLLMATSVTAVAFFEQRGNAQRERDNAIFNQVAAQANKLRRSDPSLAAQLDLTGYRMRPTADLRTNPIATGNAALSTRLDGLTDFVKKVALSPDGRTMANVSKDLPHAPPCP